MAATPDGKKKKTLMEVVAQLQANTEVERLQAAKSLGVAAIGDSVVRDAIMDSGGVQILVAMLSDSSTALQEAAISALGSIALSSVPMWSKIAAMGAVDPVLQLLSASSSPQIQQHAAWALKGMASNPDTRRVLADKAPHKLLVQLLKSPSDEVRKNAALAVSALATDSPANRKLFLEAAALDTLLDLLTDANNMVQLEATNAFRTLVYVRKGELMDFEAPVIRRILSMPSPSSATEFQLSIRAKYGDDVMSFIAHTPGEPGVEQEAVEAAAPVPVSVTFPPNWTVWNPLEQPYIEVNVPPTSDEFKSVQQLIKRTNVALDSGRFWGKTTHWPGLELRQLVRVQNFLQWHKYWSTCREIANRDDSSVLPEIYLHDQRVQDRTTNECLLFHGTSWSNINYLKKAGFTQYYRGTTPDKSLRFYDNSNKTMNVIPCAQCQRIDCVGCSSAAPFGLLICRVALGNPDEDIQSISGLTFPSTPDKDSVVCYSKSKQRSSKLDFSEYAIFDGSQAYVQYIAHVTKAPTATTTAAAAAAARS